MQRDLYIRLLEFGDNHPTGFTFQQLNTSLKLSSEELSIVETYFRNAWSTPHKSDRGSPPLETPFHILKAYGNSFVDEKNVYILTMEAKFKYIDYIELITAISNAKTATRIAIASIILSTLTLLASVILSCFTLVKPVVISEKQFDVIRNISCKIDTLALHPTVNLPVKK